MTATKEYHVLVNLVRTSWADEMDISGLAIMPATAWAAIRDAWSKHTSWPVTIYVGTNEDIEITSYNDWAKRFVTVNLTAADAEKMRRYFSLVQFDGGQIDKFIDLPEPDEDPWDEEDEEEDD